MEDTSGLLATLSQSSAAMVAIIGGFLVSRLVAISSERESIKRQLKEAHARHVLLEEEYRPVHEYRLENSVRTMEAWLQTDLVDKRADTKGLPIDRVLEENVPRGSSLEEMLPYAKALQARVDSAFDRVLQYVTDDDRRGLDLDDLKQRGLTFAEGDADLYDDVFSVVEQELSIASTSVLGVRMPKGLSPSIGALRPAWQQEVDMRRLDDSIHEESRLRSQKIAAESEIQRLEHDLEVFAQPVGVSEAIVILAVFSLLGILLPLGFMVYGPEYLDFATRTGLFICFVLGLSAVLLYIAWYVRKISQ